MSKRHLFHMTPIATRRNARKQHTEDCNGYEIGKRRNMHPETLPLAGAFDPRIDRWSSG